MFSTVIEIPSNIALSIIERCCLGLRQKGTSGTRKLSSFYSSIQSSLLIKLIFKAKTCRKELPNPSAEKILA